MIWTLAQIEIAQLAWLAALAALAAVGLIAWAGYASLANLGPVRGAIALVLRVLLVALAVLALCGLHDTHSAQQPRTVMPIDTVLLAESPPAEFEVLMIDAPAEVRPGEPFEVGVVVRAARPGSGTVQLLCDGQPVALAAATLAQGANEVRFTQTLIDTDMAAWTAVLDGFSPDAPKIPDGTVIGAVTFVNEPPSVLLVAAEHPSWQPLIDALRSGPMTLQRCSPRQLPATAAGLADFDLIVLGNVPATALSAAAMKALTGYVSELGGGLVVVGGNQAFTPGGYRHTPLEKVLPVISEAAETLQRPSLAMVLVIDQSGSMREGGAIDLAKAAMRTTVEILDPRDQLGIIAFQDSTTWIVPLAECRDKPRIVEQVDTLQADGGTNLYPALEKAWLALREAFAQRKHIIVLTDGVSHPGDFDGLVERIARDSVTVSTVAMGSEAAGRLLDDMAALGGGHCYHCDDPAAVPRVFALETATVGRLGIREKPLTAQRQKEPAAMDGLNWQDMPPLLGYVQTRARDAGNVVLAADNGDPLLVWWRCGKGVCVAFTSDARSRWGRSWIRWDQFGPFWLGVARHAMRQLGDDRFALVCRGENGRLHITLDATDTDGRWLNTARVTAAVVDAVARHHTVALIQTAPGRYSADILPSQPGTCRVEVRAKKGDAALFRLRGGGCVHGQKTEADMPIETVMEDVAEVGQPKAVEYWGYFLAALLILLPIELAARRPGTIGGKRGEGINRPARPRSA